MNRLVTTQQHLPSRKKQNKKKQYFSKMTAWQNGIKSGPIKGKTKLTKKKVKRWKRKRKLVDRARSVALHELLRYVSLIYLKPETYEGAKITVRVMRESKWIKWRAKRTTKQEILIRHYSSYRQQRVTRHETFAIAPHLFTPFAWARAGNATADRDASWNVRCCSASRSPRRITPAKY